MSYSSNAILTKARAMYAKSLTVENFMDLLNCSSVSEVANYLSANTVYKNVLSDLPTGYVKRNLFEDSLKKHMLSQFESLAHFEKAIGQELYRYFVIRNEIDQIVSCIRLLKTPDADEYLLKMPAFLNGLTTIDLFSLAKSLTYDDIINSVASTDYEEILKQFYPIDEKINLPGIESALIRYSVMKTEEIAKKSLPKKEREDFLFATRMVNDIKSISNVYRLKFIFKFNPEQIKRFVLIDVKSNIEPKKFEAIISSDGEEDFWSAVYSTCYGHKMKEVPFSSTVENRCDRFVFEWATKNFRFSVYPSVVMFCWIILAENEIKNIIHLTEGIKYNIPRDTIKNQLILGR